MPSFSPLLDTNLELMCSTDMTKIDQGKGYDLGKFAPTEDAEEIVFEPQINGNMVNEGSEDYELAQCIGDPAPDLEKPYWALFAETARIHPNNEAVVSLWQQSWKEESEGECLRWTYADILKLSTHLALSLRAQGCQPGMNLTVFLWNSAEWVLFMWAAAQVGMVFIPLDPKTIETDGEDIIKSTEAAVVVVQDSESAKQFENAARCAIRISCCQDRVEGWTPLKEFMQMPTASYEVAEIDIRIKKSDPVFMVFTSGTTSAPKGCPHTAMNVWSGTYDYEISPTLDRWLVHTPVCHILAVNHILRAMRSGGTVIFAGKRFGVESTLSALHQEKCTKMAAVPTLVRALLANKTFLGKDQLALHYITIGGTIIRPEDIRLCKEGLGVKSVIQGFGMSEAIPLATWISDDPLLVRQSGYHQGVGKVQTGAALRICAPGTTKVLARNELGELHAGGTSVISGYIHGIESASFYDDEFGHWLRTGDQARIDDDGVLYIEGRYKDLIIRGAENIAPAKIETALGNLPGINAQIIGCPDPFAGEVPVAIIKNLDPSSKISKSLIFEKARQLGLMYALDAVYFLEELGLENFPLTVVGKIKKESLKRTVQNYRNRAREIHIHTTIAQSQENSSRDITVLGQNFGTVKTYVMSPALSAASSFEGAKLQKEVTVPIESSAITGKFIKVNAVDKSPEKHPASVSSDGGNSRVTIESTENTKTFLSTSPITSPAEELIIPKLITIWENLAGLTLDIDESILKFADSITLVRYCDKVLNVLDGSLYLQDFTENQSLRQHAALLERRAGQFLGPETFMPQWNQRNEAVDRRFTLEDIVFADGSPKRLSEIISSATDVLESLNLPISGIEDFMPIKDSFYPSAIGQRPQSWHHHLATTIQDASVLQIQRGLKSALATRAIFRTLLSKLSDDTPFHIVIKPSEQLFDILIKEVEVTDVESRIKLEEGGSGQNFLDPIMFQATIITTIGDDDIHVLFSYNHTTFDILTLLPWYRDLDRFISDPNAHIATLTPFKWYADLTYMYQTSTLANLSVDFTVSRLRAISKMPDAMWPPKRSPGWMIGSDSQSDLATDRHLARTKVWDNPPSQEILKNSFIWRNVFCAGLVEIQSQLGITPKMILQTAIAVFNVRVTGVPIAVFNVIDAARSWPFVPRWLVAGLPPAASIAGPTLECTLSKTWIDVSGGETVGQLMTRVVAEQEALNKHAHVPWFKVLDRIGKKPSDLTEILHRQSFTWDSNLDLLTIGKIKPISRRDWADGGVFWNGYQLDQRTIGVTASWDTAQMNENEMEEYCELLSGILGKLADTANLDRPLRDVFP